MNKVARYTARSYSVQADTYEHKWRKYIEHTHRALINELVLKTNDRICDLSSGTGLFTYAILEKEPNLKEIRLNDLSTKMLEISQNRFSEDDRITFSNQASNTIHDSIQFLNTIISLNAFHNYVSQKEVVASIFEALNVGGTVYILDWNNQGWFRFINYFIKLFVKEHIDTRSEAEMNKMLREAGFKISSTKSWYWRYWNFYLIKAQKP